MAKNKFQSNNYNLERERFSNFVVDLRRTAEQSDSKLKNAGQSASGTWRERWRAWSRSLRAIQPNLLTVQDHRPRRLWRSFLSVFHFSRPRLSFSRLAKLRFFRPRSRRVLSVFSFQPKSRPNPWREVIRSQQRILSAAPRLLKAGRAERVEKAERLEQAETAARWYRSLFSFAIVLVIIILPFKLLADAEIFNFQALEEKILGRSRLALNNLMAAADSASRQDFKGADSNFQSASAHFLSATEELNKINDAILALASLSNDPKIKLAAESKKFLTAGAVASSLGRNLVLATDSLFKRADGTENNFFKNLDDFLIYGHQAADDARELKQTLSRINPDNLPADYRAKFISLNSQAALLADNLANFVSLGDKLKKVLGVSQDKRYLIVFQNNAELRASGGFLGSYALVDLRDGQIRNLEVPGGGSYDTEAGLSVRVAAPEPLWLVNPLWHFWDANWWPDWPTTAKNLMWFYEYSDGPSVDGVIGVTPTVVEKLLEITGPIDLTADYGLTIDADNFWQNVQMVSEQQHLEKTNPDLVAHLLPAEPAKPKKIIGDLLARILAVLPSKLDKDNLLKIIAIFEENMSEKQILLYFNDPALQAAAAAYNWAGEIKETDKDYLMVVNTNIAGQKSDRLMAEKIELASEVAPDGAIINTVRITRTHNGVKREILTGVRNVDWLRVYVPPGSVLLSAVGFGAPDPEYLQDRPDETMIANPLLAAENAAAVDPASGTKIYPENNKTVFANWLMVDPGETKTVTLKYRLPFNFFTLPRDDTWLKKLNDWLNPDAADLWPHSLVVQKQPGAKASVFTGRLNLPDGFNIFWRHPEDLNGAAGWQISEQLDADKYWSILVQKNK
ncbi:MAG: DUF4012 domain-containing protein [Patescibacteria group bacterium]